MMRGQILTKISLIALLILVIGVLGAFTQADKTTVTFLHTEFEKARVDTIENLIAQFEEQNPNIKIKQIAVREKDLTPKIASMKAAGDLPDLVELDLADASGYAAEGLLSIPTSTEAINELGEENFSKGALDMAKNPVGEGYSAVPIDGWVDIIWYRKDLFEEHDLPAPNTWERLKKAAKELYNPPEMYGLVIGTHPEEVYTWQIYQHIALSNGARAFDSEGKININTPAQVEALQFYKNLVQYTPPGLLYWRQARQYYITGRVAMIFYSNYILDDLTTKEVTVSDLPRKTGSVGSLAGPNGEATNGFVYALTPMQGADKEATKKWIKFLLTEGYKDWLFMSVGKVPSYKPGLEVYATNPVFEHYSPDLPSKLIEGMEAIKRWGFQAGKVFPLIKDVHANEIVRKGVTFVLDGRKTPEEAAKWMQEEAEALK